MSKKIYVVQKNIASLTTTLISKCRKIKTVKVIEM